MGTPQISGLDFIGSIRDYARFIGGYPPEPSETDELIRDSETPEDSIDDCE